MNYKKLMALFMSMVMVSSCVMPVCAEEFQAEENISVDFSSESSGEEFSDQQASVAAPIQQDMDGISGTDEDKFEQSVIPGEAIAWIEQSENSDSEAAYAGNTALPYEIEILGKTELSEKESEEPSARSSEQEDLKEDSLTGMAVLIKDPGKSAQELMDELMKYPQVKGVEPNYMISISSEDEFTSPEEFSDASDSQSEEEQPEICDQIKEDAAFSDQKGQLVTGKAYNKKNKTYYYFDKKGKYLKKVRKK